MQLIPCTVVLYDKGGTIERAGCLVTGCQIKVAPRSHSSRPMASPMYGIIINHSLKTLLLHLIYRNETQQVRKFEGPIIILFVRWTMHSL